MIHRVSLFGKLDNLFRITGNLASDDGIGWIFTKLHDLRAKYIHPTRSSKSHLKFNSMRQTDVI